MRAFSKLFPVIWSHSHLCGRNCRREVAEGEEESNSPLLQSRYYCSTRVTFWAGARDSPPSDTPKRTPLWPTPRSDMQPGLLFHDLCGPGLILPWRLPCRRNSEFLDSPSPLSFDQFQLASRLRNQPRQRSIERPSALACWRESHWSSSKVLQKALLWARRKFHPERMKSGIPWPDSFHSWSM
jgi:hypothetical protein